MLDGLFARLSVGVARAAQVIVDGLQSAELHRQLDELEATVGRLEVAYAEAQESLHSLMATTRKTEARLHKELQKPVVSAWRQVDHRWVRLTTEAAYTVYDFAMVTVHGGWKVLIPPPNQRFTATQTSAGLICTGQAQTIEEAKHCVDLVLSEAGYRLIGGISPLTNKLLVGAWTVNAPGSVIRHLHGTGRVARVNDDGWCVWLDGGQRGASGPETGGHGRHLADRALTLAGHRMADGAWMAHEEPDTVVGRASRWHEDRGLGGKGREIRTVAGVGVVGCVSPHGWFAYDLERQSIGNGKETGIVGRGLVDQCLDKAGIRYPGSP